MKDVNAGIIMVTATLLEQLLKLPDGHHIEAIAQNFEDFYSGKFRLRIVGPLMPKIHEGQVIPEVCLQYEQGKFDKVVF